MEVLDDPLEHGPLSRRTCRPPVPVHDRRLSAVSASTPCSVIAPSVPASGTTTSSGEAAVTAAADASTANVEPKVAEAPATATAYNVENSLVVDAGFAV